MFDFAFDIQARDMVMDGGSFATTTNPSAQNGGIIETSRCAFLTNPMLGIGIEEMMGGNNVKVAYEMNRWQNQCKNDGATLAKWTTKQIANNGFKIDTQISYE